MINQDYNFSKYKNSILIIMLFIVGLLFTLSTIWYVKNKMELLKEKQFQQEKIHLKQKLRNLLETKRKAVMSIPVVMSKDITIQEYLEHKRDINIHKLIVDISDSLRKNTDYKNIWLHIIDKYGVSLARSWSNRAGDSIYNIRKDIRDIIKSPHITSRISVGKFSMTFKSIVPIFDKKGKFIGIVEGINHFNSIIKKLKKDGIESIVLVDKKYKKQLTKNITHTFINDYYVVNFNPQKKILNLVKDKGVKYFINNREYRVCLLYTSPSPRDS
jgi:sensor histidine kinase regulating citrate/malate metabolism